MRREVLRSESNLESAGYSATQNRSRGSALMAKERRVKLEGVVSHPEGSRSFVSSVSARTALERRGNKPMFCKRIYATIVGGSNSIQSAVKCPPEAAKTSLVSWQYLTFDLELLAMIAYEFCVSEPDGLALGCYLHARGFLPLLLLSFGECVFKSLAKNAPEVSSSFRSGSILHQQSPRTIAKVSTEPYVGMRSWGRENRTEKRVLQSLDAKNRPTSRDLLAFTSCQLE